MEFKTVIVGSKFKPGAIAALGALTKDAPLTLKAEPENEFDANAVAVYRGDQHLGYVPKAHNPSIALKLSQGASLTALLSVEAIVDKGEIKAAPRITITWDEKETTNAE